VLSTGRGILNDPLRFALVALGGSLGAVLRYLLSGYAQQLSRNSSFPIGTLIVNILGCFTIGFLSELAENHGLFRADARLFTFVGILGGFTTFSAFGNETIMLLRQSENLAAIANIGAHIVLCLGAVWLGRAIAFAIWR
jgi:CrcB protein